MLNSALPMLTHLQIENLAPGVTIHDLLELFASCGPVEKISISRENSLEHRATARVSMATSEGAQQAILKFQGHCLRGLPITLFQARFDLERPGTSAQGMSSYLALLASFQMVA